MERETYTKNRWMTQDFKQDMGDREEEGMSTKMPVRVYSSPTWGPRHSTSSIPNKYEGFSYSLDILYGGLGISKLQFLLKKNRYEKNFQLSVIKSLDPDPDSAKMLGSVPDSMNPDPQHWFIRGESLPFDYLCRGCAAISW
jgi:hypothetical protein